MPANCDSRTLHYSRRRLFSWYITPENTSDGVSVCLNQDKETKMSQSQLNTVLPHFELWLLEWGNLSTQIRPAGAAGLTGSPSPVALGSAQSKQTTQSETWAHSSSFQIYGYLFFLTFLKGIKRNDLSVGLFSVLWCVATASPLRYTRPRIMILNKKYKPTKITNASRDPQAKLKALLLFWNLSKLNYEIIPAGVRSTMQPYSKNFYRMQTKISSHHPLE